MYTRLKVISVFGTRPEAIKMAPLVKLLGADPRFDAKVCVTGQHRQMLDEVLGLFDIHPHFDLNVMRPGQDLTDITTQILTGLRSILNDFSPDLVLVHGDTTTCAAATLACFYARVPVGHVEAGLRTHNIYSPWPEEANRRIAGLFASCHFAPTVEAANNLFEEGVERSSVYVTGNTGIDALLSTKTRIDGDSNLQWNICSRILSSGYPRVREDRKRILITGHRRENFGDGFRSMCAAMKQIAHMHPDVDLVYPVHLNPQVQKPVREILTGIDNVFLIDPLGYEEFVLLMAKSCLILTDSGGIQEEAPSLGIPVLVMRDTTERPEAVAAGTVRLVGNQCETITSSVHELLRSHELYLQMSRAHNPYGDGNASGRIIDRIVERMSIGKRG